RIKIIPPLITQTNVAGLSFSDKTTIRVRPTNVSAAGDSDYEAGWVIQWVETRGDDD
ncbi:MAG: hypothetical protein ISN29_10815, partial [Gammaproteobacteria bacterium AqS3]|nr:hypothetical protein [Gammaproteobacteria bacterium AqS3]